MGITILKPGSWYQPFTWPLKHLNYIEIVQKMVIFSLIPLKSFDKRSLGTLKKGVNLKRALGLIDLDYWIRSQSFCVLSIHVICLKKCKNAFLAHFKDFQTFLSNFTCFTWNCLKMFESP